MKKLNEILEDLENKMLVFDRMTLGQTDKDIIKSAKSDLEEWAKEMYIDAYRTGYSQARLQIVSLPVTEWNTNKEKYL